MKTNLLQYIAFALASMLPAVGYADEPHDAAIEDNIEILKNTIEDPTSAFISLDEKYDNAGLVNEANATDELTREIIDYASKYLGTPYRRGAKGPKAFDCSGFTSYIFSNFDIALSPSSRDQFLQGERISTSEIQPGDLLFFSGRSGGKTVGHVALAVDVDDQGRVKFIHAANRGGIRHDTYPDGGYYSKRFLGARRVLGTAE